MVHCHTSVDVRCSIYGGNYYKRKYPRNWGHYLINEARKENEDVGTSKITVIHNPKNHVVLCIGGIAWDLYSFNEFHVLLRSQKIPVLFYIRTVSDGWCIKLFSREWVVSIKQVNVYARHSI